MRRLLIVSNRLPVKIEKKKNTLQYVDSVGGLATGLRSFYRSYKSLWIGSLSGKFEKEEKEFLTAKMKTDFNCCPIFLSKRDIELYYSGFCNRTIWPLFHNFTQYTVYEKSFWKAYTHVNSLFCEKIIENADANDVIWIHDYHLLLLPKLIRERLNDATIGFFLHTPFPPFEIFRLLPWRKEILESVLEADLVGFHTYQDVKHFLENVRLLLGYESIQGMTNIGNRSVKVDSFPMGIDYNRFATANTIPKVQKRSQRIKRKVGNRKTILSIDRLDYTKGIVARLEAFNLFLKEHPDYREKVVLILVAVPSRIVLPQYKSLKIQVDELVGRINGKYGTIGWTPIWYLYRSVSFSELAALYGIADVALITPLKDGMNLMAKEFIATKRDAAGVLILSELAGAAYELGEAIIVNPNNKDEIVVALENALSMTQDEQNRRNKIMQKRLRRYNVERWATDFLDNLKQVKRFQKEHFSKEVAGKVKEKIILDYKKSKNRLILLDYDGTLVPFAKSPPEAKPDKELLETILDLAQDPGNEVVIISGRDRQTLNDFFRNYKVGLIAEHGAWTKKKEAEWKPMKHLKVEWKKELQSIFELYVDRTPGSFVEYKDFSIAWHYRRVDPELASARANQLRETLRDFVSNTNIALLEGDKTIEVRNLEVNKGIAALDWISRRKWDFILAIGDDKTDEDTFRILPESAYSIKVGFDSSQAKLHVQSYSESRSLLKDLSKKT